VSENFPSLENAGAALNTGASGASKSVGQAEADPARAEEWVRRAQAGDEDAFGELVKMYHAKIYSLAYRMVSHRDDAAELAQLTWVKAWQRLGSYKGESKFFTWVYRIASNTVLDHVRQRGRRREVSLEEPARPGALSPAETTAAPGPGPDREIEHAEVRRLFEEALAGLSPEHRMALILREVEGLSYGEIAEAMKCRKGTVMSRIFYARRAIQQKLKDAR
jgi:RNA polymerase sigma-70 factor (ECF subfamily)